jgi:hypothetical protein
VLTPLDQDHAQEMEGVRVLWVLRQDSAIHHFRLIQLAGLMKLHGGLKGLFIHFVIQRPVQGV